MKRDMLQELVSSHSRWKAPEVSVSTERATGDKTESACARAGELPWTMDSPIEDIEGFRAELFDVINEEVSQ